MAILLTGGTGKTSVRIARLLEDANIPYLLASRRGEAAAPSGMPAVKFDWFDDSTFKTPFEHKLSGAEMFRAVYLVAPVVDDPTTPMNAFIDYAVKEYGIKRFVLLADGTSEPGGPYIGKVWQHLMDIGVEYCVLRPTWFMENFTEDDDVAAHRLTIKDEDKIYSACGDGKIPFISAMDIAAMAFHALADEKPLDADYSVLGPELLTYDDQIATKLSRCLGREIVHVRLTGEERTQQLMSRGLPEHYAKLITFLEGTTANGHEERMNAAVERVTGRPPIKFDEFAQQNKTAWQ
ncbi:MAG: hypothetical protein M1816_007737 [Peltula sp. TS41687]|nr:MAG: hypothetical protein M1816_007737 [Peltula sp. TS41687]